MFYSIVLTGRVVLIIFLIVNEGINPFDPGIFFAILFLKVSKLKNKYLYTMTLKEYENQKIIFLANTFAGGPNPARVFSKEIKMSFMPTIMNVKSIHYFNNQSEAKTRILQMDRIGIIGTFADSTTANNSNLSFKLGRTGWADGNYTFRVLESENDIDTEALAGRIVITLEFLG